MMVELLRVFSTDSEAALVKVKVKPEDLAPEMVVGPEMAIVASVLSALTLISVPALPSA